MSREELLRLIAEIRQALENLARTKDEIAKRSSEQDDTTTFALALLLTSYYTGAEQAFRRIARHFGGVPTGDRWHIDLLEDMALEIPEVRQHVLRRDTVERLGRLMRFRHIVRHLYAWSIRRGEMQPHVIEIEETHTMLADDLGAFEQFLSALAR